MSDLKPPSQNLDSNFTKKRTEGGLGNEIAQIWLVLVKTLLVLIQYQQVSDEETLDTVPSTCLFSNLICQINLSSSHRVQQAEGKNGVESAQFLTVPSCQVEPVLFFGRDC